MPEKKEQHQTTIRIDSERKARLSEIHGWMVWMKVLKPGSTISDAVDALCNFYEANKMKPVE
jgi:hypothetical protein